MNKVATLLNLTAFCLCCLGCSSEGVKKLPVQPALQLPDSGLLSQATLMELERERNEWPAYIAGLHQRCATGDEASPAALAARRQCEIAYLQQHSHWYRDIHSQYPVQVETDEIAGVAVEVFTPLDKGSASRQARVLINLHGDFSGSAKTVGHLESIPIAYLAGLKVMSVDYRAYHPYRHPTAVEDVVAVYRALLKQYDAKHIGLYGCSAGAIISAQTLAYLHRHQLPMPGAVGLFCDSAHPLGKGDSEQIMSAVGEADFTQVDPTTLAGGYYREFDFNDPMIFPSHSPAMMAAFPPALMISATRDFRLSPVLATHAQLRALGVPSELHVWEGLGHAFFYNPGLPESRAVYQTVAAFFTRQLGLEETP